ncbi:MAG: replication factor C small subunit, partial [Candidatus Thermoplasmatota archaeon]|nr:replication factor C small subunit [Candidatus Thermoplasmatota archaeon]
MHDVWIEKYRPKKLDEVAGQDNVVERLKAYVKTHSLPHLLFAGPAGTGKTSCAIALAKEMFGDVWKQNFHEMNASDERGINVVRTKIKDFARTASIGEVGFKIIFLDEADALTPEAQAALRRTMEKFTKTCRFIMSVNYSSKIIEPIQSRCAVFRFRPLKQEDIKKYLAFIAKNEGLKITDDGSDAIVYVASGDMRKAVSSLQVAAS